MRVRRVKTDNVGRAIQKRTSYVAAAMLLAVSTIVTTLPVAAADEAFSDVVNKTTEVNASLSISDLHINGTGDDVLDLTLKASSGRIDFATVNAATISGRNTSYVMMNGTRSQVNSTLATMQYVGTTAGEATITAELGNNVGDVLWNNGPGGNGHAYIVVSQSMTWHQAEAAARTYKFGGEMGYLATITSLQENTFIYNNLPAANRTGWLGATDEAVEGTWRWQSGPETGNLLSYTNWSDGEPNNQSNEDCMQFVTGGQWNDISCSTLRRFVVEFGTGAQLQPLRTEFVVNVLPHMYTASFDTKGGTAVASMSGLLAGQTITLPAAPQRAGYIFDAWMHMSESIDDYQPGDEFDMYIVDAQFEARWLEDGNIDAIPDAGQDNVVNLTDPATDQRVTLELDASCSTIIASTLRASDLTIKDSAYRYDTGFVNFTAAGCADDKTTVKLYYHGTSPDGLTVRKHNPNKSSYFTISDALLTKRVIAEQNITLVSYEVTDGGDLDIDGLKNGSITDPVGLGRIVAGAPNTGLGGKR